MKKPTRKQLTLVFALLLLLLLIGGAARAWRPNRQVARAKELQRELFSPESRKMPAEERRQKWQALRQVRQKLTPAQRRELTREMGKRQRDRLARYASLSSEEKTRWLDDEIQRSEKRQQARQATGGGAEGGPGRGASAGAGGAGAPGPGRSGGRSAAERDQRRRERLDSTTPEERAQFAQYMADMRARRTQLGLSGGFGPRR